MSDTVKPNILSISKGERLASLMQVMEKVIENAKDEELDTLCKEFGFTGLEEVTQLAKQEEIIKDRFMRTEEEDEALKRIKKHYNRPK